MGIVVLFFALLLFGCADQNPIREAKNLEEYEEYFIEEVNLYNDTIPDETVFNTNTELGVCYFYLNINEVKSRAAAKSAINAKNTKRVTDYRVSVINAATLEFTPNNGGEKINRNFPVVDGVCTTTVVKIPKDNYAVLASFWNIKKWPWTKLTFSIYDRSFSALDTIDLIAKSRDTLSLVFCETAGMKFFFELESLPGGIWSEDSFYSISPRLSRAVPIPALYKGGKLFSYIAMENRRDSSSQWMWMECDTGYISLSFLPDILSMIGNGGIVKISHDSIFSGWDPTNHFEVPLDDLPRRERD